MGSDTVARWIRTARTDKSIAAVVFRVDSPGGSAAASDSIWREVILCRKEKPIIVSMSDVAGSGGYWVSMAAHKIVAQPQTLTGSIGVISGKFSLEKLIEKLGITAEKIGYGERAGIFSSLRSLTPEERTLLKREILWIYDQFLTKVSEGRHMSKEDVDRIGKGRVWTGNQAKGLNLIDDIGGLSKAIEMAKELSGVAKEEDVRLVVWPKKVSLFASLFRRREAAVKAPLPREFQQTLEWTSLLNQERIWALMPLGRTLD
jgi:protease-4